MTDGAIASEQRFTKNKTLVKKIHNIYNNNKVLLENFSFLSILQVSNLLVFIITIPFLIRTLGNEVYGVVVFAQTITTYFSLLTNFGFNSTGTRDISLANGDIGKLSFVVTKIYITKLILFFIALILQVILIFSVPLIRNHYLVFMFSMLYCLGDTLFPLWYFQGIEKMKYISIINILTRILAVFLLLLIIKIPTDAHLVPLILGSGTVVGASVGLFVLFYMQKVRLVLIPLAQILKTVKENLYIFFSNLSSHIYVNSNKILIGIVLGMQEVAIYDVAERLIHLLRVPISIIGQTLFPRISRTRDLLLLKNVFAFVFAGYSLITLFIMLFAGDIFELFVGERIDLGVLLLKLLSLTLIPIIVSLFFAELILLPFGNYREYVRVRLYSMLLFVVIVSVLILTSSFGLVQLALVILLIEIMVAVISYHYCKEHFLLIRH